MKFTHPRIKSRDYVWGALALALCIWAYGMVIKPALHATRSGVTIDGKTIVVAVARTAEEEQKGLSGRPKLEEGTGMLFIFDHPDRYGFWMPDMHFSIDIIWIGSDMHIVDISPSVAPESYPSVFKPSTPARYVLEVPAGSALRYDWKAGDSVTFEHF